MRPPRRDREAGAALIVVLIVLSLLLVVAGEFGQSTRLEGLTAANFRGAVTAAHLAEAAYHRALAEIPSSFETTQPASARAVSLDERDRLVFWRGRPAPDPAPDRTDVLFGPGRFSYRITDEASRVNLNQATPDVLQRLLAELGVERAARDEIVDSIQDWRDSNEEHRLNGAESDYYQSLSPPYRSKNAPFDSVEELLLVKGVTARIFYGTREAPGLGEYVTVVGPGTVNANTATPVVLRARGLAQAQVDVVLGDRPYENQSALGLALARFGVVAGGFTFTSTAFRIEATGEAPGPARQTVIAVVGPDGTGVKLRSWRWESERRPDPPAAEGGS